MIASFNLQEEEVLSREEGVAEGRGRVQGTAPLFQIRMNTPFFILLRLFNKSILKQQHAENTAKSAEKDISELLKLKLQNIPSPQPRLG